MHPVVRSFRTGIVEGRFISVLASLGIVGMRVALFLWADVPEITLHDDNYLWRYVGPLCDNPSVSLAASTLSVFIIAGILSLMNSRFALTRTRSNLPFVVPLFLLSLHPYCLVMTGDYIAIIFILLAFFPLLESYQKPNSYLCSFRAAILIAVASLFQIYALVLIPLWWIGERSMRGPQFRSFLSSLFGVFLVYVSVFSVFCLTDNIPGFLQPFYSFISISIPDIPNYSVPEWGAVTFIGLFFILNMIFSIKTYSRDKVITLTFIQFTVFLMVFLLLLQVVYWSQTVFFLMLSVTLVSYLNAYFYTKTTSKGHIYLAYVMLALMMLFYLCPLFPEWVCSG